jgi:hypothetical protein
MSNQRRGPLKVVLKERGPLTLNPSDYVASGGEGVVYRKGHTGIKIYHDWRAKLADNIPDKLALLGKLRHPAIVSPQGLVVDESGHMPLGFYMPWAGGEPLPRVFTNAFWTRTGFDISHAKTVAERMREAVQYVHGEGVVLVDANEMNWLAELNDPSNPKVCLLDIDSASVGRWNAKVIMPSIRDWHTREFTALSDWFSWGVVTFQVFTGVHPYKGRLDGFGLHALEERMRANASVFASGIHLNRAVRDFRLIPGPLLDWYHATFENGERTLPPEVFAHGSSKYTPAQALHITVTTTGSLIFEKLFNDPTDSVVHVYSCGVIRLASGALVDVSTKRCIKATCSSFCEVVTADGGWIVADRQTGVWQLSHISGASLQETPLRMSISARAVVSSEGRMFAVSQSGLTELKVRFLGKPILAVGKTWRLMWNATNWFDGVGVEDALGSTFLAIPFGKSSCAHIRVPELDQMTAVTARVAGSLVLVICADKQGVYHRLLFLFDSGFTSYECYASVVQGPELDATILPRGVVAEIERDGELTISVPSRKIANVVSDKHITTDMELTRWDERVLYIRTGALWSVRMK